MKKQTPSPDEMTELSNSFIRFVRRNSSWWFLLAIMLLLFGIVQLYNNFNNRTKTPVETYREEMLQLKEQIDSQEQRIKQLEEQVKTLQGQ